MKFNLGNLEMHAWHGCNLHCESCSHFSSVGLRGGPSASECIAWIQAWGERLKPSQFSIVGGEPAANRDLCDIIEAAIKIWPESQLRLVSNGFLLHRHPQLPEILSKHQNHILVISSHHDSLDYQKRFKDIRSLITSWAERYPLNYKIVEAEKTWSRRYQYNPSSAKMSFYSSSPETAWRNCIGKHCIQLFKGKLWKCPTVAYLPLASSKTIITKEVAEIQSKYIPLEPNCSNGDLFQFLALKHEEICEICPDENIYFTLKNPIYPLYSKSVRP